MTAQQLKAFYTKEELHGLSFLRELFAKTKNSGPVAMRELMLKHKVPVILTRILLNEGIIVKTSVPDPADTPAPFHFKWNTIAPNIHMAAKLLQMAGSELLKRERRTHSSLKRRKVMRFHYSTFTTDRLPSRCLQCQGEFTRKRRDARYCSDNCKARYNTQKRKPKEGKLQRFLSWLWDTVMH